MRVLFLAVIAVVQGCDFPSAYRGSWFSMEQGADIRTIVENTFLVHIDNTRNKWSKYYCNERFDHPNLGNTTGGNSTFMIAALPESGSDTQCFHCLDVLWRTPNVIQMRRGECLRSKSGNELHLNNTCRGVQRLPGVDEVITLFRECLRSKSGNELHLNNTCRGVQRLPGVDEVITLFRTTDEVNVNCISTFEGVYQFYYDDNYGLWGGCDNQDSIIKACQVPGSIYMDNFVFRMQYASCPNVKTSRNDMFRYQCYGTWYAERGGIGYTYAAISDTVEKDSRYRFKCLVTLSSQKGAYSVFWGMSQTADCTEVNSIDIAPTTLLLTRIPPSTNDPIRRCPLPTNITDIIG